MPKFNLIEWNWEFIEIPQGKGVTLKPGIDHFEILKDETVEEFDRYIVKIKKNTPIFTLESTFEFKYSPKDKVQDENQRYSQMSNIISLEASSLAATFLKFNRMPPFPFLLDVGGLDSEADENH